MRNLWIGLVLAAFFSVALAVTRDWWLPGVTRETWHQAWLESSPRATDLETSIRNEHERLLAEMEKEYGETIAREKAINQEFRLELERLRREQGTP